jgi:hypothetical protein
VKKPASLNFAVVRHGLPAGPAAPMRLAADAALNALLAPWRGRPAWLALMLVLLYWFWW